MDNLNLVSVIIPCYNSANYIQETLTSVREQSYSNVEIIVVDDGSLDNLPDIMEKEMQKDSRVSFFRQSNKGQSMARQLGVEKSKGKYLLFLDSDDKIHHSYIQKAVEILDKNPEVGIVTCKAHFFDKMDGEWELPEYVLADFLIQNSIFITSLIRKEDFQEIGGFDSSLTFYEDWDIFLSLIERGKTVCRIPEVLFYYRKRENETSVTDNALKDRYILSYNKKKIYCKHYQLYEKNGLGIDVLFNNKVESDKYKRKYYSVWYRYIFYRIFNPKKLL
ncbi:glycosyltransferase family 2 protein [Bergeyella sp. RCAD1439]|uniref:glycosyltransferase family 2 protein n=1 Tax=Bergeyella anatis TaxID=3113737 RepID=UPI002E177718|nr:glycosyltransferase [Bergeyella sp. RCAD1439]